MFLFSSYVNSIPQGFQIARRVMLQKTASLEVSASVQSSLGVDRSFCCYIAKPGLINNQR